MKLANPFFQKTREEIESFLNDLLSNTPESRLSQAVSYSLLGGGKRLRPILVRCGALAVGDTSNKWLIPAASIEMVHVYSLIHDDLPAMDNDDLRRGKPTNHRAFDEATAILAGDALQADAFQLISQAEQITERQRLQMIQQLSHAAGSQGMVGGQMLDLLAENRPVDLPALKRIHNQKTGALIKASLILGGLCSLDNQSSLIYSLTQYGDAIGLAFQITDDILDVVASTETLGKPQGSDLALQKSTYVSLLGIDGAKQQATELIATAHSILDNSALKDTNALHQLADYILTREF